MYSRPEAEDIFGKAIAQHMEVVRQIEVQQNILEGIAVAMAACVRSGRKIMWCGNGGSAADAQHLAAELVGRFRRNRRGIASIALTTDTSILTAVGNDFGFDQIFSRQVESVGIAGDLLVGVSTSGNSRNVIAAMELARSQGLATVAFTGAGGGAMAAVADYLFAVPSQDTARIQEAHILAGHMLCDWVELDWMEWAASSDSLTLTDAIRTEVPQ